MRLAAHLAPTLALVACGGSGGDRWSNSLHTPRTTLVDVGAPHVPVILYTRAGLSRIYVDNASHEAVAGSDKAIALDADATLDIEAGHYVVNRRGAAKLVIEGVTPQSYVDVAPDRKHIALTEEHTVVIASLADGTVRRFDVPAGPARDQHLGMHWAP
ncbi:MAG TPA: hypothetical protein VMZ53_28180, partial [Kofleriaceae bacterium]|nr:hypothetical protein [Kofleriaceae bacterium]